jgi:hypothetical protein
MLDASVAVAITSSQHPTSNICSLPTRLNDTGNLTFQRQLAEADTAQIKLPQVTSRPAATLAAGVGADRELGFSLRFRNQ